VEIVPQSAPVTIEIEHVDMPSVTGRWDLEGQPPRPKWMDEPPERGAITDGAAPVRGRSSGHTSYR
jgi:hypothetical protein